MWFAIFLYVILCNMNHHEAAYVRGGEKVLNPFASLLVSVNKAFHTGWNSEGAASPPLCHWPGLLLFPERFWQKGKTKVEAESMRLWDKLDAVAIPHLLTLDLKRVAWMFTFERTSLILKRIGQYQCQFFLKIWLGLAEASHDALQRSLPASLWSSIRSQLITATSARESQNDPPEMAH